MKKIEINLSDKDHDLISRIAKADNRRLSDFVYLCFGEGIGYLYTDEQIAIKKKPDEYFPHELKQLEKNKEIEKMEGYKDMSWEEKKEKGYAYVSDYLSNWEQKEDGDHFDPLCEPLAKRIRAYATEEINEEVTK